MPSRVSPTKSNLQSTKKSQSLAVLGHDLIDRKRNILMREIMNMIDRAKEIQADINAVYAEAYLALQKANITLGIVDEASQAIPIDNGIRLDSRSIMGVELSTVSLAERPPAVYYGLESTNSKLDEAYIKFEEVKRLTTRLAEVENNIFRLANAIKKSKMRTNALENVNIPRLKNTIRLITNVLEEKEREDFTRLKVIKQRME